MLHPQQAPSQTWWISPEQLPGLWYIFPWYSSLFCLSSTFHYTDSWIVMDPISAPCVSNSIPFKAHLMKNDMMTSVTTHYIWKATLPKRCFRRWFRDLSDTPVILPHDVELIARAWSFDDLITKSLSVAVIPTKFISKYNYRMRWSERPAPCMIWKWESFLPPKAL